MAMNIRGLDKFSLVDFPGYIACIVFTGGCNFRCPYCHNPHLVLAPSVQPRTSEKSVLAFLDSRRNKLDGVVISGGEPTLRKDIVRFAAELKSRGFRVKLDTNAGNPDVVRAMIAHKCVDAAGIDFKAPLGRYDEIACSGIGDIAGRVAETIGLCVASDMKLEIRSTVHRKLLSEDDLAAMRAELDSIGVDNWVLQQFHPAEMIDESLRAEPTYSDRELAILAEKLGKTRARGVNGRYITC